MLLSEGMNEQTCVQHTVLSGLDGLIGGRFVLMNKIGLLFKQILLLVCCFCVCVCMCHHIQDVFVIPLYICMSPRCRLHPTALFFHGCRLVAEQLTAALTAGQPATFAYWAGRPGLNRCVLHRRRGRRRGRA